MHHSSHGEHSPPPPHHVEPPFDSYRNQPPPPVVTHVHHSSHGASSPPRSDPSFIPTNHPHHQGPDVPIHKPTVRVYSKAKTNYSLTIRDGKVILAPSNPSDPFQHWIKDEKFSTQVKDEQGFPSFALINKATGQAMKHSIGATHPVQLIHYNPDKLDESILWTFSEDLGDGYRTIRMVNNIRLNVDAFNGDENHGGVRDGTTIVLWEWKKGANQRWKIIPYCLRSPHIQDACMVCRYSSFWEKEGNSGKSSSHPINCSVVFLTVLVKPPALRHSLEIFWSIGDRRSCNFSNAENILPAEFSCSFFNFCLIFFLKLLFRLLLSHIQMGCYVQDIILELQ